MARLTKRYKGHAAPEIFITGTGQGADCRNACNSSVPGGVFSCTGCVVQKCFDRLADYEDAEERRQLVILPFAVGEIFYELMVRHDGWHDIIEWTVADYEIHNGKLLIGTEEDIWFDSVDIGISIFCNRQDAEAKLKEMEEMDWNENV